MKRIFPLLIIALALISCKKGEEISFDENDLLGYWACESMTSGGTVLEYPPLSFLCTSYYGFHMVKEAVVYEYTWSLDGNKLTLSGDSKPHETVINSLDSKHMVWTPGDENPCRFTNMTRILPGTWKCVMPEYATYTIQIDPSGISDWLQEGTTSHMSLAWKMSINIEGRIVISFNKTSGSEWNDYYTVNIFNDDRLETLNKNNAPVYFTRL